MKTIKLSFTAIVFLIISLVASAQISVNVTIGNPPTWGPAESVGVRFYFLPDLQVYYDVRDAVFIYPYDNRWIRAAHLPPRYGNYNLYNCYKVVLKDYHGERPYDRFHDDCRRYPHGYGRERRQETYGAWKKEHRDHDEGHGHSHGSEEHQGHGDNGHRGHEGHGHEHSDHDE